MKTNEELLHPEFANFTEEDFLVIRDRILAVDKGNHQGWEEFHPDYLGALSGSILSCDCKLYPVYGEPFGSNMELTTLHIWLFPSGNPIRKRLLASRFGPKANPSSNSTTSCTSVARNSNKWTM